MGLPRFDYRIPDGSGKRLSESGANSIQISSQLLFSVDKIPVNVKLQKIIGSFTAAKRFPQILGSMFVEFLGRLKYRQMYEVRVFREICSPSDFIERQ